MKTIKIPADVLSILDRLESGGYEAYVVGGCVRDSLRGETPKDWDICTSALPEDTLKTFSGYSVIETGIKHGTVTLLLNHTPYEITTFRSDGEYSDNRRPDTVSFMTDLRGDLSRRDFTINAMGYNPKTGLADFFGGAEDIEHGIIRCVGEPDKRFREDALRILRALRFASTFGMSIERNTSRAMHDNRKLLRNISAERVAAELNKMIMGKGLRGVFTEHTPIVLEIIPELAPTVGFEQNNPHHCYDVFTHTVVGIEMAPDDLYVRLAMLFHDIAKPGCHSHKDGVSHFYGHPQAGADLAGKVLSRLKYDNNTIRIVKKLVLYHDSEILPIGKIIKRWLSKIGESALRQLLEVKRADALAQSEVYRQEILDSLSGASLLIDEIIEQQQCFSLKDLAIGGMDLIEAGIPRGPQIGKTLNMLLDLVVDEQIENSRETLLRYIEQKMQ